MIFLTTGTQLPFDRLVRAVDEWAEETKPRFDIFAQVLPSSDHPYVPRNFHVTARLSPAEYAEIFGKASLIIAHAGMGTILTALTQGKKICIMPRQARYGEHRNDHQIATAERLEEYPGLYKAWDEKDLKRYINKAMFMDAGTSVAAITPFASIDFTTQLRRFIINGEK